MDFNALPHCGSNFGRDCGCGTRADDPLSSDRQLPRLLPSANSPPPASASPAALSDLLGRPAPVSVNVRPASRWFQHSLTPLNRPPAAQWDALAGDYPCEDGWIRLHTNAPHHRAAMARVLGEHADRSSLAAVVARWQDTRWSRPWSTPAAVRRMRSAQQWQQHAQDWR